jgi:glycosyltransferase involved in cell wall biosynthesis
MKIHYYSPVHFEKFDWRNATERGIGGSETAMAEMAWRLARRGHDVVCYAPVPFTGHREWRGAVWHPLKDADFNEDGLWILSRCPEVLDKFGDRRPDQPRWILCQDILYPTYSQERVEKADRVLPLTEEHRILMERNLPYMRNASVSSNGIRADLMRQVEAEGSITRNHKKIMWASSPDRGLLNLLGIFERALEYVPDLELHAFYGFDNINKMAKQYSWMGEARDRILARMKNIPNVHWRGRVDQITLYREWLSSGMWVYPTDFFETSCITCMEAQALGAVPLVTPIGALINNVQHGGWIPGPINDAITQARFAAELVRFTGDGGALQARIRPAMMMWARSQFNWETVVDQWESWIGVHCEGLRYQFAFQDAQAYGRILNVGSAGDPAAFSARRNAVNVDLREHDPNTGRKTAAHIYADARKLPIDIIGQFDTVILGDILEHMDDSDAIAALSQARQALKPAGRVVVTCPDDHRPVDMQHLSDPDAQNKEYAPGISSVHRRRIPKDLLGSWFDASGLKPTLWRDLDYAHFSGHGVVACS